MERMGSPVRHGGGMTQSTAKKTSGFVRDAEVIAAADEQGIAMVLTGFRHFRH